MNALQVLEPGALTTIQDRGRTGSGALGVGSAGALDAASASAANRLVGNRPEAAVLEVTMGGFTAVAKRRLLLTVTGADVPVKLDRITHPTGCLIDVREGQKLSLGLPRHGVRSYIAVRGRVDAPLVLGSRSTDTLSNLGPAPLKPDDEIAGGTDTAAFPVADALVPRATPSSTHIVRFTPGPRDNWFTVDAMARLVTHTWTIKPASNRVGIRLDGPRLDRAIDGELTSEGVALGSIQVPLSGPIVFHRDHPVTGGYPVIGVVEADDLNALAQARVGEFIRFMPAHDAPRR